MRGFTDICSMRILLVSAMLPELRQTADWLNANAPAGQVDRLITGVGQLQTAYHLLKKIYTHRPEFIIQAGIGGSSEAADIGKIFGIHSEKLADLGVEEQTGFKSIFNLNLGDPNHFPFSNGSLINPYSRLMQWSGFTFQEGITVNEISSRSTRIHDLKQKSLSVVESMEGAALHYVCLMEKIPFLQIRSVSNILGERDKTRWKLSEALLHLNETLITFIQKLQTVDETLFRI